jgi:glycosyltransferase involved in cell wall biosynthesis
MKIVLATSIYPPEIGGPATYSAALKSALEKLGHEVDLQVFSSVRYPSGIRHWIYTQRLLRAARGASLVIAFDALTTGLPAAIVHRVTGVRTVARIGGDFIWERYVERTGEPLPLPHFYERREKWGGKERFLFRLTSFVLDSIDAVFTSAWQKEIWAKHYALDQARTHVIDNAIEPKLLCVAPERKNFVHFGRDIKLKNTAAFARAFEAVRATHPEISLEAGALPRTEMLDRMMRCYAVVLPSISDVTPNYILESIRAGKPFLLTKYCGYAERFKDMGVIVDPLSESDMARGIERLLVPAEYERMSRAIAAFAEERSYETIAHEFLALVKAV